ncbi:MAG: RpiR family transcriptional regulator, partial [Orrella sp.]
MMTNSAVMPFFERLSQGASKLTPSERKLVEYLLLTHPNGILDSANAIARHLAISPSTVVRFFSKIGYKNFAAAQREVRLEISTKFASPSQRAS